MPKADRSGVVQLGLAIFIGYVSIAIAFGVSGRALGFGIWPLLSLSVFVFAGASQFMAIQLLAVGTGGLSIVLATLILNSRHLVMSLSLRDRIEGNRIPRPVLAFGVTDEVFASAAARSGSTADSDLLIMEAMAYSGWVLGTAAGFLLGSIVPENLQAAMGIALYAMFVALIVPSVLRFWRYGVVAAVAGLVNWGLATLGLPTGLALLIAIVVSAGAFGLAPGWTEEDRARTQVRPGAAV